MMEIYRHSWELLEITYDKEGVILAASLIQRRPNERIDVLSEMPKNINDLPFWSDYRLVKP